VLKLVNIKGGYNGNAVITDIFTTFTKQSITSITGNNGSGKSTLVKIACGQQEAYEGSVLLFGRDIKTFSRNELARQVSYFPQVRDIPEITVSNLVMHGRFPYMGYPRTARSEDIAVAEQAMKETGIWKHKDSYLKDLSGGERQKAYIAMCLAQDTDIIFLDEPITFLDANCQIEIMEIMCRLRETGKTIIMVLHDILLAHKYSDYVMQLEDGRCSVHIN
jgi:iron complex transport system ATP-binding protein